MWGGGGGGQSGGGESIWGWGESIWGGGNRGVILGRGEAGGVNLGRGRQGESIWGGRGGGGQSVDEEAIAGTESIWGGGVNLRRGGNDNDQNLQIRKWNKGRRWE